MKRGIVCKHCGSPARKNPCWWENPGDGSEPPCFIEAYDEGMAMPIPSPMRVVIAVFVGLILACLAALVAIGKARAHDGYPFECCDHRHCRPIEPPRREGAYWILPDGRRFLAGTTRASGEIKKLGFHLCDWNPGDYVPPNYEPTLIVQPKGKPVCLFVPDAEH